MDVLDLKKRNDERADQRIRDEARIANDIQKDHPEVARTEALKLAKKMMDQVERKA